MVLNIFKFSAFYLSYLILVPLFLWSGCANRNGHELTARYEAFGDREYGGVLHLNEVENYISLFPHSITDVTSNNIASQIYEGLVRLDPRNLHVTPSLAESWEISPDGFIYSFHLRKGVFFHDDPCFPDGKGREVTADDVIYSFTQLFTPSAENMLFSPIGEHVLGAKDYFNDKYHTRNMVRTVSGLRKIDEYMVNIVLNEPASAFLEMLATASGWIYPKEAFETYRTEMRSHCVGTGPFTLNKVIDNEIIILTRNNNYWKKDSLGNQLPYLDAVKISFIKEKKLEMMEFMKGNLDMVYGITREDIDEYNIDTHLEKGEYRTDKFIVQISPSLSIEYYSFKLNSGIFDNVDIRKAFNYAIDRKKIVKYALNGLGIPAENGIVPPSIQGYPIDSVMGYIYDVAKAQYYLAKAGYPGGKGFPRLSLSLNAGGGTKNLLVAEAVQNMLAENLGVMIDLSVTDRGQHYERVQTGQARFWKDAWLADYYDPENFLCLFFGELVPDDSTAKSYLNSSRYKNDEFDNLYRLALSEEDSIKRMNFYCKADQKILDDAVVIPLYYDKTVRLLQPYVKNFPVNAMEVRDLGMVYFDHELYYNIAYSEN